MKEYLQMRYVAGELHNVFFSSISTEILKLPVFDQICIKDKILLSK
jgi:hypothetical protein